MIVRSKEWLIANTTSENGFEGWGRLVPAIGGHINIHDTAFVSLVSTHGTGFSDFRPAQILGSPEVKEAIDGKYPRIPGKLTNNEFGGEEGWGGERGGSEPETGATSYALLSLLKHWEVEEEWCYEDVVKEGVQWLMNNQREDGARGKSRKNEDEPLNLEKTCYAMMALLKYREIAGDARPDPCMHGSLGTLKDRLTRLRRDAIIHCWPGDEEDDESARIKNSFLAIS